MKYHIKLIYGNELTIETGKGIVTGISKELYLTASMLYSLAKEESKQFIGNQVSFYIEFRSIKLDIIPEENNETVCICRR